MSTPLRIQDFGSREEFHQAVTKDITRQQFIAIAQMLGDRLAAVMAEHPYCDHPQVVKASADHFRPLT